MLRPFRLIVELKGGILFRRRFEVDLCAVSEAPGPSKMSFWCGRGAIFQKFTFYWSDSFWERFLTGFGWFWDSFWEPKWVKNEVKNRSKNEWIFGSLLEGLWGAKSGPRRQKSDHPGSTGRPILIEG